MNKIIPILSIFIAVVFFISGIFKIAGYLDTTSISLLGVSFWYQNYTSVVFTFIFNFFLGGAFCYYSISTFKFQAKNKKIRNDEALDEGIGKKKTLPAEPLSRIQKITGGFSILLGLYFVFRAIAITTVMAGSDLTINLFPFIIACVFMWSKALIPIILFGKNTLLNNRITAKINRQKQALKRAKIQERKLAGARR